MESSRILSVPASRRLCKRRHSQNWMDRDPTASSPWSKCLKKPNSTRPFPRTWTLGKKTHIAFVIPIAKALAKYDCDNRKLAKSRPTINIMIQATREGFSAIKEGGYSIEPKKLYFYYMPKWILCSLFQILFSTRIAEFSMAKHSCAAKEEIQVLEEEFLSLFRYNSFYHWNRLN